MSDPINNAFSRLLAEFRSGESLAELSAELQLLVAKVQETNRPGSLTYTIRITPAGEAMTVTDEIKTKPPVEERDHAIFFPTEDHALSRSNPEQKEFVLREVPKPPAPEVRDVAAQQA